MRVDGSIASRAGQVLVLTVRNMEVCLRIPVLLSQTKIDDVDLITSLANTNQEVVRLNIPINERLIVNVLDAGNKLISNQQDGLERELAVAEVEDVLE